MQNHLPGAARMTAFCQFHRPQAAQAPSNSFAPIIHSLTDSFNHLLPHSFIHLFNHRSTTHSLHCSTHISRGQAAGEGLEGTLEPC